MKIDQKKLFEVIEQNKNNTLKKADYHTSTKLKTPLPRAMKDPLVQAIHEVPQYNYSIL